MHFEPVHLDNGVRVLNFAYKVDSGGKIADRSRNLPTTSLFVLLSKHGYAFQYNVDELHIE